MVRHNPVRHREAQPGAGSFLRREERVKDAVLDVRRHPGTRVLHPNLDDTGVIVMPHVARQQRQATPGWHGVDGVQNQIGQHLTKLGGIADDRRGGVKIQLDVDGGSVRLDRRCAIGPESDRLPHG